MLALILGVCMLNGLASPYLPLLWSYAPLWMVGMLPDSMSGITYASSLAMSTLTLMASGVPAALYERFTGQQETSNVSYGIWLGAAMALTTPAWGGIQKLMEM